MSPITAVILSAITTGSAGYWLGRFIHDRAVPRLEDIAGVPAEELEAREHKLRRIMFDAERTSMPNPESGMPATITQARIGAHP